MADLYKKLCWREDNEVALILKINRNTDPELYQMLADAKSKSGLIRELLREGYQIQLKALEESLK